MATSVMGRKSLLWDIVRNPDLVMLLLESISRRQSDLHRRLSNLGSRWRSSNLHIKSGLSRIHIFREGKSYLFQASICLSAPAHPFRFASPVGFNTLRSQDWTCGMP